MISPGIAPIETIITSCFTIILNEIETKKDGIRIAADSILGCSNKHEGGFESLSDFDCLLSTQQSQPHRYPCRYIVRRRSDGNESQLHFCPALTGPALRPESRYNHTTTYTH